MYIGKMFLVPNWMQHGSVNNTGATIYSWMWFTGDAVCYIR